jgi:hypothetical protein
LGKGHILSTGTYVGYCLYRSDKSKSTPKNLIKHNRPPDLPLNLPSDLPPNLLPDLLLSLPLDLPLDLPPDTPPPCRLFGRCPLPQPSPPLPTVTHYCNSGCYIHSGEARGKGDEDGGEGAIGREDICCSGDGLVASLPLSPAVDVDVPCQRPPLLSLCCHLTPSPLLAKTAEEVESEAAKYMKMSNSNLSPPSTTADGFGSGTHLP